MKKKKNKRKFIIEKMHNKEAGEQKNKRIDYEKKSHARIKEEKKRKI